MFHYSFNNFSYGPSQVCFQCSCSMISARCVSLQCPISHLSHCRWYHATLHSVSCTVQPCPFQFCSHHAALSIPCHLLYNVSPSSYYVTFLFVSIHFIPYCITLVLYLVWQELFNHLHHAYLFLCHDISNEDESPLHCTLYGATLPLFCCTLVSFPLSPCVTYNDALLYYHCISWDYRLSLSSFLIWFYNALVSLHFMWWWSTLVS